MQRTLQPSAKRWDSSRVLRCMFNVVTLVSCCHSTQSGNYFRRLSSDLLDESSTSASVPFQHHQPLKWVENVPLW